MRRRDTRWQNEELGTNRQHYKIVREQLKAVLKHGRRLFGHTLHSPDDMFSAMDRDFDGHVTLDELKSALRRLDVGLSEIQVRATNMRDRLYISRSTPRMIVHVPFAIPVS